MSKLMAALAVIFFGFFIYSLAHVNDHTEARATTKAVAVIAEPVNAAPVAAKPYSYSFTFKIVMSGCQDGPPTIAKCYATALNDSHRFHLTCFFSKGDCPQLTEGVVYAYRPLNDSENPYLAWGSRAILIKGEGVSAIYQTD